MSDLWSLIFVEKWIALFSIVLLVLAPVGSSLPLLMFGLSVHFFQHFSIHTDVGRWSWLNAVNDNFVFVGTDFHVITSIGFLQFFSEPLEFSTASQQRTASCRAVVLRRTLTTVQGCEFLLHLLMHRLQSNYSPMDADAILTIYFSFHCGLQ